MSSKENPEDIEQKIFGVKDSQETYVPISTKKIKKIIFNFSWTESDSSFSFGEENQINLNNLFSSNNSDGNIGKIVLKNNFLILEKKENMENINKMVKNQINSIIKKKNSELMQKNLIINEKEEELAKKDEMIKEMKKNEEELKRKLELLNKENELLKKEMNLQKISIELEKKELNLQRKELELERKEQE